MLAPHGVGSGVRGGSDAIAVGILHFLGVRGSDAIAVSMLHFFWRDQEDAGVCGFRPGSLEGGRFFLSPTIGQGRPIRPIPLVVAELLTLKAKTD